MASIADFHFPCMVWREGSKLLWNPIHKKALKNRPEERVRLRIIEALVSAGWSKHRISTEETLNVKDAPAGRTDIICYDQNFTPQILIECKAENVPISSEVAEQTARYNRSVDAPYLLMTNGVADHWFKMVAGQPPEELARMPDLLAGSPQKEDRDFHYWTERGFAGKKAQPRLRDWLTAALTQFWLYASEDTHHRFIGFNNSPTDMELSHYFKIQKVDDSRVATGFLSTPYGGSRLLGVINQNSENVALVEVNLDLLADETAPNATIYAESGPQNFDFRTCLKLNISPDPHQPTIQAIPSVFLEVYRNLAD